MNNASATKKNNGSPVKIRTIVSTAIRQRGSNGNGSQPVQRPSQRPETQPATTNWFQRGQPKLEQGGRRPQSEQKKTNGTQPSQARPAKAPFRTRLSEGKIIVPELMDIAHIKLDDEWDKLDRMILDVYEKDRLTDQKKKRMKELVDEFEEALRAEWPGARLDLFGSSVNGCGSANCDLDICFRFKEDASNQNALKVLRKIKTLFTARYKGSMPRASFWDIDCRVPIVKFKVRGMEGDVSFYNDTALKNTAMFRKYCEWEPRRFPPLIMFVKRWAKDCTINCSAAGTLSSYSLSLMLIHYLQQCSPAVFPPWNLDQDTVPEDYDFGQMPAIENWSNNTQSVGQLFVGFLDYYSRFDFNKLISILRIDLADKEEKKYTDNLSSTGQVKFFPVAIEDPYLPEFNPGYAVRHKMAKIRATFRLSREVFMGKCKAFVWNDSIIKLCTHFFEEGMDDFERDQLEGMRAVEMRAKSGLPAVTKESMTAMAHRVFKAIICCGGAGRFNELRTNYKLANKSDFMTDKKRLFGATNRDEIFTHPFLKKCVAIERNGHFTLKEGLFEEVAALVDRLYGFTGEEDKKMVEEGARRFLKVIRSRHQKMDHYTFLMKYQKLFEVPFNVEERMKYFGTSDMDEIVEIVCNYGLITTSTQNAQSLFHIKSVLTYPNGRKEVNELIRRISASLEENDHADETPRNGHSVEVHQNGTALIVQVKEEVTPPNEAATSDDRLLMGVDRLKNVLRKLPPNEPLKKMHIRDGYRRMYRSQYNEEERRKLFGIDTFHEVMMLLNNHEVEVKSESKGMYSYSMTTKKEGGKKSLNGTNHPFLNPGAQSAE